MAFETLDIKIKAESGDAESALESVRDSLEDTDAEVEQFDSSLRDAEESTDDLKNSSAALSATLTALNTASSGAQDSIEELSDSATGATASVATLGGSITALEAALVPLAAVLTPVAAGLGAVAGAAGLVVGSGLLAFGEELAANNERRLEQINSRIGRLNALESTEAGLTAQQQETLTTLEDRRKAVKEQTSATGALAAELGEVKTAFADAFSDAGEQFVPLVRDGLNALPPLIRDLGDAFENAGLSNVTGLLRDIGGAINQNAVGAFETFLELANDTAGGLRRIAGNEAVRSFVSDLASAAGDLGSALGEITGDIIDFLESDRANEIFQSINEQVEDLAPDLVELSENVASVFDTLERNPGAVTGTVDAVGSSVNALVDALNLVLPILRPVIRELGDAGRAFNKLDGDVQSVITLFTGPFGIASIAVINALADIVPSVNDVATAFDDLKRGVKNTFQDIGSFLTTTAPGIIQSGARGLFNSLITAAKELKRDLIGNSILKDIFTEFAAFLRGRAVTLLTSAADTAFTAFRRAAENAVSYLLATGGGPSLKSDLLAALRSIATSVKTEIKNKINAAFGAVADAAENAVSYLLGTGGGPSLKSDLLAALRSIATSVKTEIKSKINAAFVAVADAVTGPLDDIGFGGIEETLSGLLQTAKDVLSKAESVAEVADNISFPDPPSVDGDNGGGSGGGGGSENSSVTESDVIDETKGQGELPTDVDEEVNEAVPGPGATDPSNSVSDVAIVDRPFDTGFAIVRPDKPNEFVFTDPTVDDPTDDENDGGNGDDDGGNNGDDDGDRDTNPDDPAGPTDPNPSPRDDNPSSGGDDGELDSGFGDGRPGPGDAGGPIGLATGGVIDSGGLAVLHSGERIIPSAEVAERGGGGGVTVNIGEISANSRAEGRQAAKGLKDELKRFDI